jgi:hypothetical protein
MKEGFPMRHRDHLKEQMNDPEFEKEYKLLEPEFEHIRQTIFAKEEKQLNKSNK